MRRMADFELDFVEWLRTRQKAHPRVALGIGDDMAVLVAAAGFSLLTSDMLLDGVHFDAQRQPLDQIGRKAIACSLSDCAAMATRPVAATVSVALPRSMTLAQAQELYGGMLGIAEAFDLSIVGGDTTRWAQSLVIDVHMLAEPWPDIDPVTRNGARAGDRLCVTGALGGSLLGRHLQFMPRVLEARRLGEALGVDLHAMMDISDGLALDLWRMTQASGVGALLDERLLRQAVHDDARRATKLDGRSVLDHVLTDGEDFELLIASGAEVSLSDVMLIPIGEVIDSGLSMRQRDGAVVSVEPRGFVH